MSTRHQAVALAVADLLRGDPALVGDRVYLGRIRALNTATQNAIVVRLERSASQHAAVLGGPTGWSTLISVECYGRDPAGADPCSAADAVAEGVFAKLDQAVLPYGADIEPYAGDTLSWDIDELDTSMACITARFVVKHQTTGRTLTL